MRFLSLFITFILSVTVIFADLDSDFDKVSPEIRLRIAKVLPCMPGWSEENASLTPITGGATNYNFHLFYISKEKENKDLFIRVRSKGIELSHSTLSEEVAIMRAAAQEGLAPKVIALYPEDEILITEYIHKRETPIDLTDAYDLARVCHTIKKLHSSSVQWNKIITPIACIKMMHQKALNTQCKLAPVYWRCLYPALEKIAPCVTHPYGICPCHLDLHPLNMIDDGRKTWLVDWEFAAISDPLFDLAGLASVGRSSDEHMHEILSQYLSHVKEKDIAYFYLMRILIDIRWYVWCQIQMLESNVSFDYEFWANWYLSSACERIQSEKFSRYLELLQTSYKKS